MVVAITSVAGVLSLLDEPEAELKSYALDKLNGLVDQFWTEIADSVLKIELLYENPAFPDRQLAALVASKVYFALGEQDEALQFALGAGKHFDVERKDEYTDTVVSKAIDAYIDNANQANGVDERLKTIVDQMFARCIADREYKQALGIALETRRLDIVETIFESTRDGSLLAYVLEAVMGVVQNLEVRKQVLHLLVKLFQSLPTPDHFSIAQCYVYLNAPELAARLLSDLARRAHEGSGVSAQSNTPLDPLLIAYQIAFDLAESATQEFLDTVRSGLEPSADSVDMAVDEGSGAPFGSVHALTRLRSILGGEESIQLYLDFLTRANHADLTILKATKDSLDARNSVYHNALTFSNAFMNAGTTSDRFMRENLDWLVKAGNWSKFTATAALGVINKGNLTEGISILRPYLPADGVSSSVYSEGGSLFALGLVHANHGAEVMDLLKTTLKNNPAEIVQHGAALGLGAAGMATGNEEVYEELRNVLYTDSAVAGEAAGYAMGLVMLGTGSEKAVEEMLQYAHETQHEKIIRGLAVGLALLVYGREEKADGVIDTLMADKDAILRYGGIYAVALAYAGTGNNRAVRRLLHVAVSDVNDDVRRAAVTGLGFLLFRNPTQVPRIVQLLSESYNPYVRYGSTLALGISCAGTGLIEAVDLLEPMLKDPTDFVRQGAAMSLAMVLIQQNEALNPRVAGVRAAFAKMIGDKHEDAMAKFGAAVAQGLIDAGGRNVTIGLQSRGGNANMPAIVGMALFTQFWYWFPLAHFASLALMPTALIGLDRELRVPAFEFVSAARPSLFAYPQPAKKESEKKLEKVETAVLSTTVKAQARQRNKERERAKEEGMDMDEDVVKTSKDNANDPEHLRDAAGFGEAAGSGNTGAQKRSRKERKPEPTYATVPNCSRVTPAQLKHVEFPASSRYVPIRPVQGVNAAAGRGGTHDTSTVVPKGKLGLLGNTTPAPGASGHVTPSGPPAPKEALGKEPHGTSSAVGGGGGILLMVDRKPGEPFEPLRVDAGTDAPGDGERAEGAADSTTEPARGPGSEISPEDQAAILAALQEDDGTDDKEQTGVHPSFRRGDGEGGGGADGGGHAGGGGMAH